MWEQLLWGFWKYRGWGRRMHKPPEVKTPELRPVLFLVRGTLLNLQETFRRRFPVVPNGISSCITIQNSLPVLEMRFVEVTNGTSEFLGARR